MKLQIEIKEGNHTTTYSADLTPVQDGVKSVADTVGSFLKKTFKKETFIREDK